MFLRGFPSSNSQDAFRLAYCYFTAATFGSASEHKPTNVENKAQRENLVRCEIVGVRSRRIAVETVSEVNRRKIDTLTRHSTSDWHFCNAYNAPSIKINNLKNH